MVVKIEWRQGQLFPEASFIVMDLRCRVESVVRFYNRRAMAERWIKEDNT